MTPIPVGPLLFSDEFTSPEQWGTKWTREHFGGTLFQGGTISPSNVVVHGGVATLTCTDSGVGALMSTNPKGGASPGFQFGYGFLTARIKLPVTGWPAFWTDGQTWPEDGETDIVELISGGFTSNYHSGGPTHGSKDVANNSQPILGDWAGGYHTYAVNRQPSVNDVFWDGKLIRSYPTYDNGAPQYLLFTHRLATNGSGKGTSMVVDWVRCYAPISNEENAGGFGEQYFGA